MKQCKLCSKALPDRARFCPSCGTECTAATPDSSPRRQTGRVEADTRAVSGDRKKRRKVRQTRLIGFVLAVLAVMAGVIFALSEGCRKPAVQSYPAAPAETQDKPGYTSQFADSDASSTKIEVPGVTGLPLAEARLQLERLGLAVEATAAGYDPAYADGIVLSQSKAAGEWALSGDHVALTYNALPLTCNVFAFGPREGRITLGNLLEVCGTLGTTNPTFAFSIIIHAGADYELKGGFRCLTGANEKMPIARVNTQLVREGKAIRGLIAENAYDDSIGWTISLDDWTGFHFDNVTGYDVVISSREDAALSIGRSYQPMDTKSMTLLDCGFDGGRIRLDVATQKQMIIRLTDVDLSTGYPNSAEVAGDRAPVWQVKLPVNSYQWIAVTIDGSGGEPVGEMKATGTQFIETKSTAKNARPSSFDGVSYTVDGDTLVISVTVPDGQTYNVYEIAWLELTMGDGAYTFKTRIR